MRCVRADVPLPLSVLPLPVVRSDRMSVMPLSVSTGAAAANEARHTETRTEMNFMLTARGDEVTDVGRYEKLDGSAGCVLNGIHGFSSGLIYIFTILQRRRTPNVMDGRTNRLADPNHVLVISGLGLFTRSSD